MTRILVVRGHRANPWELRSWLELPDHFEIRYLRTRSNRFETPGELEAVDVRALRDFWPKGALGDAAEAMLGDRYLSAEEAFAWADIVHAAELGFWFAADAARRRRRGNFKLLQTVWETLPLMATFRNHASARNRERVLAATDLFLPTTERAALALQLEGVPESKIKVCPPGIDLDRFAVDTPGEGQVGARSANAGTPPNEHVIISPGRLVWEKGHQDVLRAVALLHRGLVTTPTGVVVRPRLAIVGSGPEERRLHAYARELGLADHVEIGAVPYDEMPARFASASAMVLASQATAWAAYHPFDVPRAFWEEQFGMVLAEGMAAGLDIVSTTSGAIPEVLAGTSARLVAPGDWPAIAQALADGPLSRPPGARVDYPSEVVQRYSTAATAARLAEIYDATVAASSRR